MTGVDAGFTLIEIMLVVMVMGLISAMVVPNLGAFVPKARMDAAAKTLVANIDHLRSEAQIQGKRCALELDLDHAMWRLVFPPEERLTTDQDVDTLEERFEEWQPLEKGVTFVSAGNAVEGVATNGKFRLVFDHNGFTGDQSIVLRLDTDHDFTWTVNIRGITGQCDVVADYSGHDHLPEEVGEGSF